MSVIKPFRGVRPRPDLAHRVASPPYDVLNSEEAREMAAGNLHSFLHVVKAEIDLPGEVDVHSERVYALSKENFEKMRADGVFVQDDAPCFYLYQLRMRDHVQTGVAAGASLDEYESGTVKKHELTRPEKENDRARHMEVLQVNPGPVLCTFRTNAVVRSLLQRLSGDREPLYDFVAADGVRHRLWRVCEPGDVRALREAFAPLEALYIADGHHRSAAACKVRALMKERNPHHTGKEGYNDFLAVLFPDEDLRIMGYHRVVKDLGGHTVEGFLSRIEERFFVEEAREKEPDRAHLFALFLGDRWYELTAKPGTYPEGDPIGSLDASILQENLLGPVLGIRDPRTDHRIDFVGGIRGTRELVRRCRTDMKAAFALAAVTVDQLMAIANAGAIMPPKSTWFEPKLRSGLVVRTLEG